MQTTKTSSNPGDLILPRITRSEPSLDVTNKLLMDKTKAQKLQETNEEKQRNLTDTTNSKEAVKYSFIRDAREHSLMCAPHDTAYIGSDCDPYTIPKEDTKEMDMQKLKAYFKETPLKPIQKQKKQKRSPNIATGRSSSAPPPAAKSRAAPTKKVAVVRKKTTRELKLPTDINAATNLGMEIFSKLKVKKEKKSSVKK
ncbi:hypothetical protein KIN20_003569 [Parelaphostrongylus tenuis]|uniref:Uncharacterized protein n=1 Tax=Parelaphostrongylus tenuis TaxID=148309 RepID=A0AAD5MQ35_PARTN|nr:hypothetical protein KIN20_003569 [Parelaphostrongylus tenuis]